MAGVSDGRGEVPAAAVPAAAALFSAHGTVNLVFLILLAAALVALWSLRVSPKSGRVALPFSGHELPELCQHVAAGEPCPSCGLTRSVIHAAHGDPARSREYHRAGLPVFVMLLAQIAMRVVFLQPSRRSVALDVAVSAGMLAAFAVMVN
ncbi:MAG TPA: DUF2752 domain-containing protein [Gemmata sp.]|nr:DUF2752 domain-containing protein [Gemmata sp.]